ncbi:MAG: hypothetical protein A2X82_14280 [Geobacteraceae bacterium GWC2_55_20]|nr:MAG: hypothetical protein A2X82_14280 [Geobacteraceae bacterium GWC2_55_20]OGU25293.1 MAG: hypothetical protein A2X85_10315 [Geobacteraceae bacterium GWF2_54_21]HBA71394.1 hypothetical protein [Geobacter sp.]HCE66320.1 hypothetical protein [Geobacter sp.]
MIRVKTHFAAVVLICALLMPLAVCAADSSVYYFTGRVSFFDGIKVVADGKEYRVIDKCIYRKHTKQNNAYFEDKAGPNEVRGGDSVVLHVNGNVVDKIIIEEWKR